MAGPLDNRGIWDDSRKGSIGWILRDGPSRVHEGLKLFIHDCGSVVITYRTVYWSLGV
jgi:hypothetical protein